MKVSYSKIPGRPNEVHGQSNYGPLVTILQLLLPYILGAVPSSNLRGGWLICEFPKFPIILSWDDPRRMSSSAASHPHTKRQSRLTSSRTTFHPSTKGSSPRTGQHLKEIAEQLPETICQVSLLRQPSVAQTPETSRKTATSRGLKCC